jgi:hypothetical protein
MVISYATSINVVLLKVPPHATPVSQPADVAWNFPIKSRLRQRWHEDMQDQIRAPRAPGKVFKLKKPDRTNICGWVQQSWEQLSTDTIANGFTSSGLLPGPNCFASADRIADLEKLSLVEGPAVTEEQDFEFGDIVEEAVV